MNLQAAPILVSVYHRLDHFQNCIRALQNNPLSKESILYVVSDAPALPEHEEIIMKIRNYTRTITGFKAVELLEWDKNLGSYCSIKTAMDSILKKHDRVIFLEDDIIASPYFLDFVNRGLDYYVNDQNIFSISGYSFPVKYPNNYPHTIYKWSRFNAWGFGTWSNRWFSVDFELNEFDTFLKSKRKVAKFKKDGERIFRIINLFYSENKKIIDGIVCYHMFKNNSFTIYPIHSLTLNGGFDGSGEHCSFDDSISSQILLNESKSNFITPLKKNRKIFKLLSDYFNSTPKISLKTKIKRILKKILKNKTQN